MGIGGGNAPCKEDAELGVGFVKKINGCGLSLGGVAEVLKDGVS
jgi:hypothetical protein